MKSIPTKWLARFGCLGLRSLRASGLRGTRVMQRYRTVGSRAFRRRIADDSFARRDNRIGAHRYDFTESQFANPITCLDVPAKRSDAERGATASELVALRLAFERHSSTLPSEGC
jgi:hypothetical protein